MEEPMKGEQRAVGSDLYFRYHDGFAILFAGPIVKALGPLGLLATSAVLAILGLYLLSSASGLAMIFVFATLYGFGKTFFWPTTFGVVSEQCPKGGALVAQCNGLDWDACRRNSWWACDW